MRLSAIIFFCFSILLLSQCKSNGGSGSEASGNEIGDTANNYFPVTNYILGQIAEIKSRHINPLKYVKTESKTDSSWVKEEDIEKELADILTPVIDTVNMKPYFSSTSFEDQTLNSYTFVFEKKSSEYNGPIQQWMVFVNPQSGVVKRVFLIKSADESGKMLQLTWNAEEGWYKKVVAGENANNNPESETLIKWNL